MENHIITAESLIKFDGIFDEDIKNNLVEKMTAYLEGRDPDESFKNAA